MSLSLGAYAFVGVEIPAVTAVEAVLSTAPSNGDDDESSIRPANAALKTAVARLPFMVAIVYFVAGLMVSLNVPAGTNLHSPAWLNATHDQPYPDPHTPNFSSCQPSSAFVLSAKLASEQRGSWPIDKIFTIFILVTAWSAANTTLYVSSRTLYGLTSHLTKEENQNKFTYWAGLLGRTTHTTEVPLNAMMFSVVAFIWVPYLQVTSSGAALRVCERIIYASKG